MATGKITGSRLFGTYTPTFSWSGGGTAPTVSVTTADYIIDNGMMTLMLRFQVTAAGSGSGQLRFSLPSGWVCEYTTINAPIGTVINNSATVSPISVVRVANGLPALFASLTGGAFDPHAGTSGTSHWGVFCVIPVRQS